MQQNLPFPEEYKAPMEMHQQNTQKLVKKMKDELKDDTQRAVVLIQGGETTTTEDQTYEHFDIEQESCIFYLFGVNEMDCYGLIDLDTGKRILFVPKHSDEELLWKKIKSLKQYKEQYQLDDVLFVESLEEYLEKTDPSRIYVYDGIDSDSKLQSMVPRKEFLRRFTLEQENLYWILNECRIIKSPEEIKIMKFVCDVSSRAHIEVLRRIRDGNYEYQIAALFKEYGAVLCDAKYKSYNCVCAGGRDSATLHYIYNQKKIEKDTLLLCDMGHKYYNYCADITVTFPSSGKFTDKQKIVYNAVLDAQQQVYKEAKPGVNWGDLHLLAERVIVKHLHAAGILVGDLDQIIKERIGALFFPVLLNYVYSYHGLGHQLGLRVHDVGGYNRGCPERLNEPGLKNLRFRRNLEPGMIVTNEPGCYFIDFILKKALDNPDQAKFLNKDLIMQFIEIGGVRLEDDCVVTETGMEPLHEVPRTVEQVEACMRGEDWKKI